MATTTLPSIERRIPQGGVVLQGIRWKTYEQLLEDVGEQRMPHSYVDEELILMAPSPRHESLKEWLTFLVAALTEELGLPRRSIGSTTLKLTMSNMGAEPDAGFLIANATALGGKRDWDPELDPPPDLLIEIDISHTSPNRIPVYAALSVPELWIYDGESLRVQRLDNGVYHDSYVSASFPSLPLPEFATWIEKAWETDESTWMRDFREWVRNTLKPK